MHRQRHSGPSGFTAVELLLTVAVLATVFAIAVPMLGNILDEMRTSLAAQYLAGRVRNLRFEAIRRSTAIALRFEAGMPDYTFAPFADGNRNGLRTAEILDGTDPSLGSTERLSDNFSSVRFGLIDGIPDVDGVSPAGTEGVRIGLSRILTMAPNGTATSGTLYIRGERSQYAVRVLGATGRTRVLRYDRGTRRWITR